jgi:hypothetical protein
VLSGTAQSVVISTVQDAISFRGCSAYLFFTSICVIACTQLKLCVDTRFWLSINTTQSSGNGAPTAKPNAAITAMLKEVSTLR